MDTEIIKNYDRSNGRVRELKSLQKEGGQL